MIRFLRTHCKSDHTLIRSSQSDQLCRSDWITEQSDLAPLTTFQIFNEQQRRCRPLQSGQTPEQNTPGRGALFWILFNRQHWWSQSGSNRRPPACKAGALPAELWPLKDLVGLGGFEPPTSPLSGVRSNQLSYRPEVGNPGWMGARQTH